jgi:hypothetical protein
MNPAVIISSRFFFLILISALCSFGQLSVIRGTGPSFPKKIDSINFIVKFNKTKALTDSSSAALDTGFYGEFKQNIDSTIPYVDAVRLKRKEIEGAGRGIKFDAILVFSCAHSPVMKAFFSRNRLNGALLDVKADKVPFVVVFNQKFIAKLDSISSALRSKTREEIGRKGLR